MKNKSQDSSSRRLCFEYLENRELLSATPLDATVNDAVVLSASVGAPICLNGSGPEVAADVTNVVSERAALSDQNMLEYACSETSPEDSVIFSHDVEELLASVSKTGWNPVKRWVYYDDGMYDQTSNQAPLNYYYGTDGAIKLKEDGPLCEFIDRAKELELNGIVWKCEIDDCFDRAYLEWDPIAGAQSYRVFQSTDGGQTYVNVMSGISAPCQDDRSKCCYEVPLLKSDAVYTFKVDALGNDGKPLTTVYVGSLNASTGVAAASNPDAFRLSQTVDERVSFLKQVKAYANKKEIEIIPTFWAVGCNAFLSQDASLVEGRLVEYAPFNINEDPNFQDHEVAGDGFEGKWSSVPANWEKTDTSLNFVEKSDGASEGSSSVLVKIPKLKASDGIKRVFTGLEDGYYYVTCKVRIDGADYAEMKVQNPDNTNSNAYVDYKPGNENFEPNQWGTMTSGVVFVTQGRLEIQLSGAGPINGKLWFDDLQIIQTSSPGFLPIPREGAPVKVFKKVNDQFVEIPQKDSQTTNWELPAEYREHYKFNYGNGFYAEFEQGTILKNIDIFPQDSPLRKEELDKVYISYYEPTPNEFNPQRFSVCLSEPGLYDLMRESAATIQKTLEPKTWFIAFDEVTIGGTCETCHAAGTTDKIFGGSVAKQYDIIRNTEGVAKNVDIVVWSDMFDTNHNAKGADEPYQNVAGSLIDAVNYLPRDLIIACWYDGTTRKELEIASVRKKAKETLSFFSTRGFKTISSCYYDWSAPSKGGFDAKEMPTSDPDFNTQGWLYAMVDSGDALNDNLGMFYLTWPETGRRDYDYLDSFGKVLQRLNGPAPTPDQLDAPTWKSSSSTAHSVTVAWNAVTNAKGYRLEYKRSSDSSWSLADQTTSTTATFDGLAPDSTYKFRVYALGDDLNYSNSEPSSIKAVKTKAATAQLVAPTWKPSSSTANSITIAWNAVTNAKGYRLEYKLASDSSWSLAGQTTSTTATINGLTLDSTYKFRVYALGDDLNYSNSEPSSIKAVKTKTASAQLVAPTWKSSSSTANSITIAWNAVTNAKGYRLEYKLASDSSWSLAGQTTSTTATINGLTPDSTYKFRVYALGDGLNYSDSEPSSIKAVKTKAASAQLVAPTWKPSSSTANSITIAWNAVTNAKGYRLEYKLASDSSWSLASQTTSTTATIDDLTHDSTYKFRVYALGDGVNYSDSEPSSIKAVKTKAASVTINYDDASHKASVSWTPIPGAATYKVQLSKNGGETWPNYRTGVTTTSIEASGLYAGRSYGFRIYGVDGSGKPLEQYYEKMFSPIALTSSVTEYAVGSPIRVTLTAANANSATIKWSYVKETGDVEITAARNSLTFTPTTASYDVKVVAIGSGSSQGCVSTLLFKRPIPSNTIAVTSYDAATRQATLAWGKLDGATKYTLKLSKDGGVTWINYKTGLETRQATVNGIYVGKSYAFRVYAATAAGATLTNYAQTSFTATNDASAALDDAFADFFEEELFEEF